jgi:glycosyltransferase involved in cell wall biosynthesis
MARIVHVCETLSTGTLSVLATLVCAQVRDGHKVWLIGSQKRPDTLPTWRDLMPVGLHFVDFPMEREISPADDLRAARALRKELLAVKPDAVHLHSSKAGALGRLAAFGLGLALVYQPHGLPYLRRDVSPTKQKIFAFIEFCLARLGGTVVACSQGEFDALRGVAVKEHMALICNGIAMEGLPSCSPGGSPLKIGTCGRIAAQKRPFFFAEVATALKDRARFVWVGDGDADGRQALIDADVEVTGWRTRQQCLDHMAGLDIYIQTSEWEGMPISVIEAMAIGLPVVATDIVGNRDLIQGTDAGILISTPQDMIQVLAGLIDEAPRRRQMGESAHRVAHERYSSDAMVQSFYSVYGIRSSLSRADTVTA